MSQAPKNQKALTIGDIEADKSSSIWVLNKSNPKGNITITVPNGMGNTVTVVVPVTWIPVDMTTQATKQSLLASPVFRRMMTLGMIAVVSENEAQALLTAPEARTEMSRIYAMPQELSGSQETIPAAVQQIKSEAAGDVSGFALNISHTDSLDEAQVMNALKGNEGTMSEADMKYVVANSKFSKVKAYMTEQLLDLSTAPR